MRISRYEFKDSKELYCTFHLSDQELLHLNSPEFVKLRVTDGKLFVTGCRANASNAMRLHLPHKGERRFQVFAPVFPGTKPFGLEEVPTAQEETQGLKYLEALFPEMNIPLKVIIRGTRREKLREKVDAAAMLGDADLVRALNERIRKNPMWRPAVAADRTITITVSGVIA